jgi:tetratricopeptide (TPR) repeat protein
MIASIAACLLDNLFNMSLRTVPVALLFWMLMGLAMQTDVVRASASGTRWRRTGAILAGLLMAAASVWYAPLIARRYDAEKAFLRGLMDRYAGKTDEARREFSLAAMLAPRHMEARFFLAANLTESGNYREAAPALDLLIADRPNYPRVRTLRAIAAGEAGDSAFAMQLIAGELRLETSPQAYYFGSHIAARLGNAEMKAHYLLLGLQQNVRSGMTDYLLEALDDLPSACQTPGHYEECTVIMEALSKRFAAHPDVIRRLEEIRLEMRTG